MGRDLPKAIHDLKKPNNREIRARLGVPRSRRPPLNPYQLLSLFQRAVALAEIDRNVVYAGHVDDGELLICREWITAVVSRRVTQLDYQAEIFERAPHKELSIPKFVNQPHNHTYISALTWIQCVGSMACRSTIQFLQKRAGP